MAATYAVTTLQPGQPGQQFVQLAQPQTLVIASQPPEASGSNAAPQNVRDWNSGLYACLGDCSCKLQGFYCCPVIRTILETNCLAVQYFKAKLPAIIMRGNLPVWPKPATARVSRTCRASLVFSIQVTQAIVQTLLLSTSLLLWISYHICSLFSSCFMHIRDLLRIRPMLKFKTALTIATSIVYSKINYCNFLFIHATRIDMHQSSHITFIVESPRLLKLQSEFQSPNTNLQLYTILPTDISLNTLQHPIAHPSSSTQLFRSLDSKSLSRLSRLSK